MRHIAGWIWSRHKRGVFVLLLLAFVALNGLAYLHARAMTHFDSDDARTAPPESLTYSQKAKVLLTGVSIPRPQNHATPDSVGLAFTVHEIQSASGMTLEAWHIQHAQAKALVCLFHGYAACKANLLNEAKALHEMGYAVLLVDFRGSGGSSGNITTIGVDEAEDVTGVWQYTRRTSTDQLIILYGQSMGSAAILRALSLNEGIHPAAVVLECPFDRLRSTVANRFSAMGLPALGGADLLLFWGSVQMGFNGYRHNPVEYARAVHCPVLLMHGAKDTRVTKQQAEVIFNNLAGEKEFELLDKAGHEDYLASCPEQWKRAVSEFLDRQVGTSNIGK